MYIEPAVLRVLNSSDITTEGTHLRISGRLDRKTYVKVNKVLEACGGKWSRKERAHVFQGSAEEAINGAIESGKVTTHQDINFFPTPLPVVHHLAEVAELEPGMTVLEPSAGLGNIAYPLIQDYQCTVTCVEKHGAFVETLYGDGIAQDIIKGDFLTLNLDRTFNRVVMNPPFSMDHGFGIDHVLHALTFLEKDDDALLVSVMSANIEFSNYRKQREFRDLIFERGGAIDRLPENSFAESGTGVNSVLVIIPGGGQ